MVLCFFNLYGPYTDREIFWKNISSFEFLKNTKMIFGGDLNFSLGFSEIWGVKAKVDSLSDFFSRQLDVLGLVDLTPSVLLATWYNRRFGGENICKRLDRLLILVDLLDCDLHFHQWVGCGGDSDH